MTFYEIAMLKRFMHNKGIERMFMGFYSSDMRIASNPKSLEEFLRKADVKNVFLTGFYFVTNSDHGYVYWSVVQKNFVEYIRTYVQTYSDDLESLSGVYKYLRHNYDTPDFWKKETLFETARRLQIHLCTFDSKGREMRYPYPPFEGYDPEAESVSSIESVKPQDKYESPELSKPMPKQEIIKIDNSQPASTGSDFDEFEEIPMPTARTKMKPDEVSVNGKARANAITFNGFLTQRIRENGNYMFATMIKNKNGDIGIKFKNNSDGGAVRVTDSKGKNGEVGNIVIHSKPLVGRVAILLGTENTYRIFKVKEVSNNEECIAFAFINE